MKREIKFRFWQYDNDGNGIMYSFDEIKKFDEPQLTLGDYIISPNRNKDIILMQFVGLKDKNDKEIYEGDIIKWMYGDYEKPCINEVTYAGSVGRFDIPMSVDGDIIEVEIIGNIYENPELLTS